MSHNFSRSILNGTQHYATISTKLLNWSSQEAEQHYLGSRILCKNSVLYLEPRISEHLRKFEITICSPLPLNECFAEKINSYWIFGVSDVRVPNENVVNINFSIVLNPFPSPFLRLSAKGLEQLRLLIKIQEQGNIYKKNIDLDRFRSSHLN